MLILTVLNPVRNHTWFVSAVEFQHGVPYFTGSRYPWEGEFLWTKSMLICPKKASCTQAENKILVV